MTSTSTSATTTGRTSRKVSSRPSLLNRRNRTNSHARLRAISVSSTIGRPGSKLAAAKHQLAVSATATIAGVRSPRAGSPLRPIQIAASAQTIAPIV